MVLLGKEVKVSNFRQSLELKFHESFKRLFLVNKIFCAAPIKLRCIEPTIIDKIASMAHLLYGFAICGAVCFATYLQHAHFDKTMGFLTRILYMGEYIIGTFNLLLIIVGCQYQKRFYMIFFNRLVNVDINLQKCGFHPNFETTRIYLQRSMIVYAVFLISVILVDFFYNDMIIDSFLRSSTVYTIPNIVSVLALTQYSSVLHFIRDKFRTINAILVRLVTNRSLNDSAVNNKLNIISVIAMNSEQNGNVRTLNTLRKQHNELTRLLELLNKCFGLLIVLTLIAAYIILSTQFYAFYRMTEGFDESDIWLTLYTSLWVLLHGGKVLLILYPNNDITDEREKTGRLLFEMDISEEKSSNNVKIISMMKTFANQLLHDNRPPNALRVIHLDLTIVGTMLGVLTTYLIILIQFDASAREPREGKSNSSLVS